jgi:hypothetical protein
MNVTCGIDAETISMADAADGVFTPCTSTGGEQAIGGNVTSLLETNPNGLMLQSDGHLPIKDVQSIPSTIGEIWMLVSQDRTGSIEQRCVG